MARDGFCGTDNALMATVDELHARLRKVEAMAAGGSTPAERATARRIAKSIKEELLERGASAVAPAVGDARREELLRQQRELDAHEAMLRARLAELQRQLAEMQRVALPEYVVVIEVEGESSGGAGYWSPGASIFGGRRW